MVVHDGAVPETVLGIGTSTVIMAFVSQFLKNEIAQLQEVEGREGGGSCVASSTWNEKNVNWGGGGGWGGQ